MSEIQVLKLGGALLNSLPENFSFNGTLDLSGSSLKELPKGLFIQEDLIIGDADIHCIPEGTIIGGDLIDFQGQIEDIHETVIVGGKFCFYDYFLNVKNNKNNYITLENGDRFYYQRMKHYSHEARDHEFDRTPFDFYYGYSSRFYAVVWTTPEGNHAKPCKNMKEAKLLVNMQDAIERGLEKYRGLDIDAPMLGHDILEIYQVCTHSCMKVVNEYLNRFDIDLDKYYTLREIGYTIQQFKVERYAPASDVFMTFFNIPEYGHN